MTFTLPGVTSSLASIDAELSVRSEGMLQRYFPEKGPYRRALYPKHVKFFEAGREYRERALIAANRVGKSDAGVY